MKMQGVSVHWFSILNSIAAVFILSIGVAYVLIKTLRKDIDRYSAINSQESHDEHGWKLCHADVFRPPSKSIWLAVFVGSGAQFATMIVVTLFFALLGFLSPANRGSLLNTLIAFYCICRRICKC